MDNDRKAPHLEVLRAESEGGAMNIHTKGLKRDLTHDEAADALALLRQWAAGVTDEEIAALDPLVSRLVPGKEVSNYPPLARAYLEEFEVDEIYKKDDPIGITVESRKKAGSLTSTVVAKAKP